MKLILFDQHWTMQICDHKVHLQPYILRDTPVYKIRTKISRTFKVYQICQKKFLKIQKSQNALMNRWRYYSANLRKICNIIGPET